jgi:hypothetical protein
MAGAHDRLLEIYLADHLAAASAGVALARRAARSNTGNETGDFLRQLTAEIDADRQTLRRVVASLGFDPSALKNVIARVAERVGRLKLNGQLRGYSPLSRVLELEALSVGIAGKLALWESLQQVPDIDQRLDGVDLEQLVERALQQRAGVEEYRIAAVRTAFAGGVEGKHVLRTGNESTGRAPQPRQS